MELQMISQITIPYISNNFAPYAKIFILKESTSFSTVLAQSHVSFSLILLNKEEWLVGLRGMAGWLA